MTSVREVYTPTQCPANSATVVQCQHCVGGFFATAAGNLAVTVDGAPLVPIFAMQPSVYYPLPFTVPPGSNVTFTTSSSGAGVAGTL